MASTRASISKASKKPKINILPPKQLFVDLTQDDTKTSSPKLQLSSPSAPNAPSKTPSTKDTSRLHFTTLLISQLSNTTWLVSWRTLSPDAFRFILKKRADHNPAYDFFAPAPLPGYVGNPNNNNGWLAADDYLLGELKAMVKEQMVVPAIEEVDEPVAETEEEQVIAPAIDMKRHMDGSNDDIVETA
ncbi:hypothetical protein Tco_1360572 [Tanacetum coccineum]